MEEVLKSMMQDILEIPEAATLLLKVERGEIPLTEAVVKLQEIIRGTGTETKIVRTMGGLSSMGFDVERLMYQHPNGEQHLNPLFEAKIVERLSQDGDIPELRVGALPKGCSPAVPVLSYVSDPVIMGLQLEKASDWVVQTLEHQTQKYIQSCENNNFLVPPSKPIDVIGVYEVGKTPTLLKVDPIDPKETLLLSPEKKRELVHKCIGTTQGRRSCITPIEAIMRKRFSDDGINIVPEEYEHVFTCTWQIETWGPEDLSENFNPITQAAESFFKTFKELTNSTQLFITIKPVNGYSDRIFGWQCTFNY